MGVLKVLACHIQREVIEEMKQLELFTTVDWVFIAVALFSRFSWLASSLRKWQAAKLSKWVILTKNKKEKTNSGM